MSADSRIWGQDKAVEQFLDAWKTRSLHHAWLLTGPRGVGKASFAMMAAARVLADAAGPAVDGDGLFMPADHPVGRLVPAATHPDFRLLERIENKTGTALQRNITVDQVRSLGQFMDMTSALSPWGVVVIDSADDLEPSAANALLKMLEEPPANTIFFLVSHVPGRLLPTIRSRCRKLEFQALGDDAMTSILRRELPQADAAPLVAAAEGSIGRALAFASLDLTPLREQALAILCQGDADNARRSKLAKDLGPKAAADRYAAFLDLVPSLIAREARGLDGAARNRALDAYARARETTRLAPRLSLDPAATVFQLGGILASVAQQGTPR